MEKNESIQIELSGKPTIGRIVIYRPTHDDKIKMTYIRCNVQDELPAIISAVNEDRTVNLKVLLDGKGDMHREAVKEGEEDGQWSWPVMEAFIDQGDLDELDNDTGSSDILGMVKAENAKLKAEISEMLTAFNNAGEIIAKTKVDKPASEKVETTQTPNPALVDDADPNAGPEAMKKEQPAPEKADKAKADDNKKEKAGAGAAKTTGK